jgi:hypothetical protein
LLGFKVDKFNVNLLGLNLDFESFSSADQEKAIIEEQKGFDRNLDCISFDQFSSTWFDVKFERLHRKSFNQIVCEGDSLQVIKGICNEDGQQDRVGHFLLEIKQRASCFSVCNWSYCCREANVVAHLLARKAASMYFSCCWIEVLPLFISSASLRDCLVSKL